MTKSLFTALQLEQQRTCFSLNIVIANLQNWFDSHVSLVLGVATPVTKHRAIYDTSPQFIEHFAIFFKGHVIVEVKLGSNIFLFCMQCLLEFVISST